MMKKTTNAATNFMEKSEVMDGKTSPEVKSSLTMKAVTWQGKRTMAMSAMPMPKVMCPTDVVVKMTACSICCGADTHLYAGDVSSLEKGMILGHEAMGIVESKGERVTKVDVGDRVVMAYNPACGLCDPCARGEYSCCCESMPEMKNMDMKTGHIPAAMLTTCKNFGMLQGSQAEYVRVPFADVNCFKVPDQIPDDKALFLSELLPASYHATEMGQVKEGDTVVIWGMGPVGMCAAQW
jgi:threonine dehydrogenase-like Zn-dependent dehydrogenase